MEAPRKNRLAGNGNAARRDLWLTAALTLSFLVLAHFLDIAERWQTWSNSHEAWEIDEIPLALAITSLGLTLYAIGRWKEFRCQVTLTETANAKLISEIKVRTEAESNLKHAKTRAEALAVDAQRANFAKSEFLATMSHEIRTPLGGVIGMAELLLESDLSDEQRNYAGNVLHSANGLLTIINDILNLSKLEAGKLQLELTSFRMSQLTDQVVSLLSPIVATKDVTINVNMDQCLPDWLQGDSVRLRQILFNLIGNAVKFTEQGSITISVSHQKRSGGDLELRCEVKDTGIGIPADAASELFSRFTQVDNSTSRKFGGTGLGLAICKQLAELIGGSIGMESVLGEGSTFWLTIPCTEGEAPSHTECLPAEIGNTGPLHILVAEDNPVNQQLVTAFLKKMSHSYEVAGNGVEALEAIRSRSFDLVLMDIQMPVMDGVEATRAIRLLPGTERNIPIVALTANAMVGSREEYLAAGMDDYVPKPVNFDELQNAIARVHHHDAARVSGKVKQDNSADDADQPTAVFDLEKVASLRDVMGEEAFQTLIGRVPDESTNLLSNIQQSLAAGNLESAQRAAHGLKGMASNVGAERIEAIARRIELEAKTVDAASKEVEQLESVVDEASDWIKRAI